MLSKYEDLGLIFTGPDKKGEHKALECPNPECGKSNKFSLKNDQYKCWSCGVTGNWYTFVRSLYSWAEESVELSSLKKIPFFNNNNGEHPQNIPKVNPLNPDEYIIPAYNCDGKICNLWRYIPSSNRIMVPSDTEHYLVGAETRNPDCKTVIIVEGHWDYYALSVALNVEDWSKVDLFAIPGASVQKEEWCKQWNAETVILLYDNDVAGKNALKKTRDLLQENCSSVQNLKAMQWKGKPQGYDVKDWLIETYGENYDQATDVLDQICKLTKTVKFKKPTKSGRRTELSERNSLIYNKRITTVDEWFSELQNQGVQLNTKTKKAMQVGLATQLAAQLRTAHPLWIYFVAQSGAGKSRLIDCFLNSEYSYYLTKLTGLVSGLRGAQNSIIPDIDGRMLTIPELTPLLKMDAVTRDKVFGELREIYGGSIRNVYLNNVEQNYEDIYFGILAGVTDQIRKVNNTDLGERFLTIDVSPPASTHRSLIRLAIQNANTTQDQAKEQARHCQAATAGLLQNILERSKEQIQKKEKYKTTYEMSDGTKLETPIDPLPQIPDKIITWLEAMSLVVGKLRSKPETANPERDMVFTSPREELGTRIAVQISHLLRLLSLINNRPIDREIYEVAMAVVRDTIGTTSFPFKAIQLIYSHQSESMSRTDIDTRLDLMKLSAKTGFPKETVRRSMQHLRQINAVQYQQKKSGKTQFFQLTPDFYDLVHESRILNL
tara:strand:+ start:14868 stop:17024 length:2157 start_codon:yes stop_codon:yes gene_type:complete